MHFSRVFAVLDIYIYNVTFDDMRLGGIITIGIGCCVVLLPENWPDYITRLIRFDNFYSKFLG